MWTQGTERLAESIFKVASCVSVGSVAVITIYILVTGAPAIAQIGLGEFLFGREWAASSEKFGILALILSSIAGTAGAILLGVPIGILTAVFLSETARPGVARLVRPAVELLAGIPSVIYGFFGMLVIVPAIRTFPPFQGGTTGDSLLAAILILAIMVLPTIVNVSETALHAVPVSYREASLALGATPTTTIFKVTVPAAKSGILAGVILGVGRAIGETMAVIMVAGNVPNMPSLLGPVRFLTTGIAMEMSYSSGLHRQALFAIGLVLFVFIMIVNISFTYISKKGVQMDAE
nr:phosphate ABC transporter permease subunit PstC [Clostridium sp. D33t1_170424_F3]